MAPSADVAPTNVNDVVMCDIACAEGQLNGPGNGRMNGVHNNPLAHPYPQTGSDAGPQMQYPGQQASNFCNPLHLLHFSLEIISVL